MSRLKESTLIKKKLNTHNEHGDEGIGDKGSEWIDSIKQERAKQTHSTLVLLYTAATHKKKKRSRVLSLFIVRRCSSLIFGTVYIYRPPPPTTERWDMPNERRRQKKRVKGFFLFLSSIHGAIAYYLHIESHDVLPLRKICVRTKTIK